MQTYRHLTGWLFVFCVVIACLGASSVSAEVIPAKTTVHDVVYRADGMPANGEALISWPGFTTADGAAVAAGSLSVTLKTGGVLDAALVPNAGSLPASTYYTVVFHLDDGKSSTEYWSVPSGTTVRIADIRSKIVSQSVAVQTVSRDYVTQSLKPLAQDTAVVHLAGSENVGGAKNFTTSPTVPIPQSDTHAANKRYVDNAIQSLNPSSMGMIASAPASDQSIAQPSGTALKVNRISATTLNGTRFADQFANIQAAITDAGTTGSVTIPSNYTGTDTFTNPNGIQIQDLRGKPDRQKGFINAVTDCGLPTDRTSDSCSAMTACIAAHPGKTIGLPAMVDPSSNLQSYYSSCRWTLSAAGTKIVGLAGKVKWTGGIKVKFPTGVGAILTTATCASCGVENLFFEGSDLASSTDTRTYEDYTSFTDLIGDGPDCVQFNGGEPWASGVRCSSFKRHGFHINGSPGQPDIFHLSDLFVDYNRGFGVMIQGADSNVGLTESLNAIGNQLGAWYDGSYFGSTLNVVHTSLNARNGVASGAAKTVSTTSVTGGVKTINAAAHGWISGQWVTDTGSADSSYNGTCKLTQIVDANTVKCNFNHLDGSTSGGTAHSSSGTEIFANYLAKGIHTGSIVSTSTSLINGFYEEGNQSPADIGNSALGVGGIHSNPTGNWIYSAAGGITYHRTKFMIFRPQDSSGLFIVRNVANDANMFTADPNGNVVAKGLVHKFGAIAGTNNGLNLDNAMGVYIQKADHTANIRAMYLHTDNVLHLGDTVNATKIDGPFQTTNIRSTSASNTDIAGIITLASGTGSYNFTGTYATAPICVATDTTAVAAVKVTVTTTKITVTGTGTDVINYICVGRT